jgi:two-component system cell cycle response regulator
LSERIREQVSAVPMNANGHLARVTVSIGAASEAGDTLPSLEAMLGRADEALYQAKREGRNRVVALQMQHASDSAPAAAPAAPKVSAIK